MGDKIFWLFGWPVKIRLWSLTSLALVRSGSPSSTPAKTLLRCYSSSTKKNLLHTKHSFHSFLVIITIHLNVNHSFFFLQNWMFNPCYIHCFRYISLNVAKRRSETRFWRKSNFLIWLVVPLLQKLGWRTQRIGESQGLRQPLLSLIRDTGLLWVMPCWPICKYYVAQTFCGTLIKWKLPDFNATSILA